MNVPLRAAEGLTMFDVSRVRFIVSWAAEPYGFVIDQELIVQELCKNVFDGISSQEILDALILSTVVFVERDPAYGYVAARFLKKKLFQEIFHTSDIVHEVDADYKDSFVKGIKHGVAKGLLDPRMLDFDLESLSAHLDPSRDDLFDYMGLKTLYERYFLQYEKQRFELPQSFWMRVAMGLCYLESNKTERVIQFYNSMSQFYYIPSTPTLLHAGLMRPQLSSCFLTTVEDDLKHIFKCYSDNAQLSKWSGGVANDWTNVRATGAMVNSIKTESQGVIPFLKIASDVTAAINRSGKRRGATCVYLETWHYEIEDFIDLRKNTGDERRRTHDINTANWIPDLFMKRVMNDEPWTLFSPEEVSDLHHIYGEAFEKRYTYYEQQAEKGAIKLHRKISAKQLWRKMLNRLFETGHPWITFKDAANARSPQDHAGVIHSSNLCTEILLNTSADETAVCNLGSINLSTHIIDGVLDYERLKNSIHMAIRMLDNVIDINFYPTKEAQNANLKHRPIGLGLMGFQDALYKLDIEFESQDALSFVDKVMEFISYHAILASSYLARELGAYSSFAGSKWDRGIFPLDTLDLLQQERGLPVLISRTSVLDWDPVREHVKQYGMRNSNVMAIAPTATISNVVGCYPCIEPIYKNMYVKANMTGEFTVVNKYLIEDLKKINLWNADMLELIKYYDGSIQKIDAIPLHIRNKYKEAFELDQLWLVELTATRAKWIDQSQSHNVFLSGTSGKLMSDIFFQGWHLGMKTFYYVRTLGASQIEKSTLDATKFGFTQKRVYNQFLSESEKQTIDINCVEVRGAVRDSSIRVCSITQKAIDDSCEACQ